MSDNKYTLSGVCPYCPAVLDYAEDSRAVKCHCCGNVIPTAIIRPLNSPNLSNTYRDTNGNIANGITSSGMGVIYFDNFCDSYSWSDFSENASLSIPELDNISEVCKLKFPADPLTYYLDFRCIAIPLTKKIDALDVLEKRIVNNYFCSDFGFYSFKKFFGHCVACGILVL